MTQSPGRGPQHVIIGIVSPVLLLAGVVVPFAWTWTELPSPIAIHFDLGGDANGSAALVVYLLATTAVALVAAAFLGWAARAAPTPPGAPVAVAAFVGSLMAALTFVVLAANRGRDQWEDATLGPVAIPMATATALVAAAPVALLMRRATNDSAAPTLAPKLDLTTTERAAWFGTTTSRVIVGSVGILVTLGAVVMLVSTQAAALAGFTLLTTGLAMAAFSSVEVAVGEDGLRVRTGLRWPRVTILLADIQSVRVVEWRPLRGPVVTGWGYRGSLRLLGRAGWVVRGGPALQLELTGGRQFIVTADGAVEAASVLNGLLAREHARRPAEGEALA